MDLKGVSKSSLIGLIIAVAGLGFALVPDVKSWPGAILCWIAGLALLIHGFRFQIGAYFGANPWERRQGPPPRIERVEKHDGMQIALLSVHNGGGEGRFVAHGRISAVSQDSKPFPDNYYEMAWDDDYSYYCEIQRDDYGEIALGRTRDRRYLELLRPAGGWRPDPVFYSWQWRMGYEDPPWVNVTVTIMARPDLAGGNWTATYQIRANHEGGIEVERIA